MDEHRNAIVKRKNIDARTNLLHGKRFRSDFLLRFGSDFFRASIHVSEPRSRLSIIQKGDGNLASVRVLLIAVLIGNV